MSHIQASSWVIRGSGVVLNRPDVFLSGSGVFLSRLGVFLIGSGVFLSRSGVILSGSGVFLNGSDVVLSRLGVVLNGSGVVLSCFRIIHSELPRRAGQTARPKTVPGTLFQDKYLSKNLVPGAFAFTV
jgi:hypothetical protein